MDHESDAGSVDEPAMMSTIGLLLAAGAGRRMGKPKALVTSDDGVPWVLSSVRTLRDGGCDEIVVVIGAEADAVRAVLTDEDVRLVEAAEWAEGMSASLKAGLDAIADRDTEAALVHLVDLPDVGADVVRRLLAEVTPGTLLRAMYHGAPGHPVLFGRQHWAAVAEKATGDRGARDYLAVHDVVTIECGDLATGRDVDDAQSMLGK